jgi:cutinase
VSASRFLRYLGAALATLAVVSAPLPTASAQPSASPQPPCPDVELIFARGTFEPPGVGGVGQAFVDALRSKLGNRSLEVYAVNYPASTDFPTAIDGVRDASAHIEATAANCPKTKMVLGGFSQGAAVMGFVTSAAVPDGVDASGVPAPMRPEIAEHVAAIALLGKPSNRFMSMINSPPVVIGPLYTSKTLDLCIANDPICADSGDGAAHNLYAVNGMVDQAADFAATRL